MAKILIVVAFVYFIIVGGLFCFMLWDTVYNAEPEYTAEMVQDARYNGIAEGCEEMFIAMAGPAPSEEAHELLIEACYMLADRLTGATTPEPVAPGSLSTPTMIPGSLL